MQPMQPHDALNICSNHPLDGLNTFGVRARAKHYVRITKPHELVLLHQHPVYRQAERRLVLGGGSNILFTQDYDGLVIHNAIEGMSIRSIEPRTGQLFLEVGSGMNWHRLVEYTVKKNWGGLENLALIPGTVGAAPVQNIGAYGVELKNVFDELEAFNLETGTFERFDAERCAFGYRDSFFKRAGKGKYIITMVCLCLCRNPVEEQLNTSYGALSTYLQEEGIGKPTAKAVAEAVIAIRQSKLPDPKELGNCGSFFKNPVLPQAHFERIEQEHPQVPHYPAGEGRVKVPAAWLIEQAGWKGKRVGPVGSHEQQALVLVNYGGATGMQAWALAKRIQEAVFERFGVALEPEVNVL